MNSAFLTLDGLTKIPLSRTSHDSKSIVTTETLPGSLISLFVSRWRAQGHVTKHLQAPPSHRPRHLITLCFTYGPFTYRTSTYRECAALCT